MLEYPAGQSCGDRESQAIVGAFALDSSSLADRELEVIAEVLRAGMVQHVTELLSICPPRRVGVRGGSGPLAYPCDHRDSAFKRPTASGCGSGDAGEESLQGYFFAQAVKGKLGGAVPVA